MDGNQQSPEFRNPPVIETVLGLQFSPIPTFTPLYAGLFWHSIKDRFPKSELRPPIFSGTPQLQEAFPAIPIRAWFLDRSNEYLLQIQPDRFLLNWRKSGETRYPSYRALSSVFQDLWGRFADFVTAEGLPALSVGVCEVTYVDHIDGKAFMGETPPVAQPYTFWSGGPSDFIRESGLREMSIRLEMPQGQGQVQVQVQPAVRIEDAAPIVQLTFTALRPVSSQDAANIWNDLDSAKKLSVRAFLEFTSPELQEYWGRIS